MRQPFVQRAGVFQNKWVVPRDESVESLEDDLRYEGSHYSLKSVRVKCDSDKITRFYVTFVERWNSTSSEKDGKNVFVFKDGERLKIMALYFSFATKFDQLASTEKTSAEVTHAAFKRARIKHFPRSWTEFEAERIALPSIRAFRGAAIPRKLSDELSSSFSERKDLRVSLTPERQPSTSSETRTPDIVSDIPNPDCSSLSMDPGKSEATKKWTINDASLCGIEFKTTLGRTFKFLATKQPFLASCYELDVGSGYCCGMISETTDDDSITGLGFVFLKETNGTNRNPIKGDCLNLVASTVEDGYEYFKEAMDIASHNFIPLFVFLYFTRLGALIIEVLLPLYDVVSDINAGEVYIVGNVYWAAALILFFVILLHLILSLASMVEMMIGIGEFDDLSNSIVQFYKSNPASSNWVDVTLKSLTLPIFALFNFVWFVTTLIGQGFRLLYRSLVVPSLPSRSSTKHQNRKDLRLRNVKEENWSKNIVLELIFETIPELLIQIIAAAVTGVHSLSSFAILSSICTSAVNLVHQSFVIAGFMRTTNLSYWSTVRYTLSSSFDFFPLLNPYRNATEHLLIYFYDSSLLLQLWGALCAVLKKNTSLKMLTLYLEDDNDWIEMLTVLLEAVLSNKHLSLDFVEVRISTKGAEKALVMTYRIEAFKPKLYKLLEEKRVQKVYILASFSVNVGISDIPIADMKTKEIEADGYRWSWEMKEKSNRIKYCIQRLKHRDRKTSIDKGHCCRSSNVSLYQNEKCK